MAVRPPSSGGAGEGGGGSRLPRQVALTWGGPHLAGNDLAGGMQQHHELAFVYSKVPASRYRKSIKTVKIRHN